MRAFGVFYCGGSAIGIAGPDGEAIQWPDGECRVQVLEGGREATDEEIATDGLTARCGGTLSFTIEEAEHG